MKDSDREWFRRNAVTFDLFGANFYPWSYGELRKGSNGYVRYVPGDPSGNKISLVLREAYESYHMPVMITETSSKSDIHGRARWMDETLETVRALRAEGVLRRHKTPLVKRYQAHMAQPMPPIST